MRREEIAALTGLRGVAALWVFLFHADHFAQRIGSEAHEVMPLLGAAGYLGVDLFFVLSGFILAHNYLGSGLHADVRRYGRFLWKRLARIYPVHLFALALLLALQGTLWLFGVTFQKDSQLGVEGLLATLTLTHAWSLPVEPTWNTVSWSISCEWAAYLLFPAIALLATRVRTRGLACFIVLAIFVLLGLFIDSHPYKGTMAFGLPRIAAEFIAGVFLYRIWMLRGHERDRGPESLALLGLVALIPLGNLLATGPGYKEPLVLLPVFACAVVYGLAAGTGPLTRLLASPLATYAGRISYSFYMVHGLVLSALTVTLRRSDLADGRLSGLVTILAALVATTLLAAGVYRWCELPMRRSMIALASRRTPGWPVAEVPALGKLWRKSHTQPPG